MGPPDYSIQYSLTSRAGVRGLCDAGIAKKTYGEDVQAVDGEPFKLFGMSPTAKNEPVFLYEQIIEPTLGYGEPVPLRHTEGCIWK